jgi:hypothetical protein
MGNVLALIVLLCCVCESLRGEKRKKLKYTKGSGHGGVVTKQSHIGPNNISVS